MNIILRNTNNNINNINLYEVDHVDGKKRTGNCFPYFDLDCINDLTYKGQQYSVISGHT